jgi:hypothetical protein
MMILDALSVPRIRCFCKPHRRRAQAALRRSILGDRPMPFILSVTATVTFSLA